MKMGELSAEPAVPADTGNEEPAEPQFVTETTPNGTEIYYSWEPRRHYKLNDVEVPSVTTTTKFLTPAGPISWKGMVVGVEGVQKLERLNMLPKGWWNVDTQELVDLLTANEITVNHDLEKASTRGTNVHKALEHWCDTRLMPDPELFPDEERGYVVGLVAYLHDISGAVDFDSIKSEIMVGSLEYLYAGRYDLRMTLTKPCEVVTRVYPKRKPKIEEIPAGDYLKDAKTTKGIYESQYLQLEGYEKASVECGHKPTDYRAVLHLTADGRYELAVNKDWTFEDYAAVRHLYMVLNEREVLRALREELDAKEAA